MKVYGEVRTARAIYYARYGALPHSPFTPISGPPESARHASLKAVLTIAEPTASPASSTACDAWLAMHTT